ncbi:hypothetical protein B7494_g5957 [Chlorociboria aeruginascens]|nr:hypothetical protein B7494_g5957 [Chlorociboria aeruginascens]
MSYQRSPSPGLPPSYSSAWSQSTQTVNPSHDVVIPPGTVAARIRYIRSLTNAPFIRPKPPNIRREKSRAVFGRRLSNISAQPASPNDKADKHPQVEAAHTVPGLNTPRRNHEEEHAITDHGARRDRTPGLDGHIQSDGRINQAQYEGKPSKKTKRSRRRYGGLEIDIHSEVDTSRSDVRILTEASVFPSLDNEANDKSDTYRREPKSGQDGTTNSKISNKSSSTIRRKSVRDLFEDYGVERPPGLASSEDISCPLENIPMPRQPPHRYCHNCSWINKGVESKCLRCSHHFCIECDGLSPFLSIRQEAIINVEKLAGIFKGSSFEEQPAVQEMRKDQPRPSTTRPGPTPLQVPKHKSIQTHKTSSPMESPAKILVTGVAADDQRFRLLPATPNGYQHRPDRDKEHHHNRRHSSSSYSHSRGCESSACHATHHGHNPSIICTRSKPRAREETDNGYAADTSHIEDAASAHSNSDFGGLYSRLNRTSPSVSPFSKPIPLSPDLVPAKDLVECNGYPRTGHTRHSSPITSGIVGECQHCLHDCICKSCQKTEHRVRCCLHEDHHAMQHYHQHSFAKEQSAIPREAQGVSQHQSADLTKESCSSAPTVNTVLPHTPKCEIHSASPSTQTTIAATPQRTFPRGPAPSKKQSLPKSKTFTLVKEPSKLYPKAPWVIASNGKDAVVTPSEIFRRNVADGILGEAPNPRATSNYKKMQMPYKEQSAVDSGQAVDQSQRGALTSGDQSNITFRNFPNSVTTPARHDLSSRRGSPFQNEPPTRKKPSSERKLPSQKGSPSPPVSSKPSDLYDSQDENQAPLLTQKLQERQDELRKIEKLSDESIDIHSPDKSSPLPPDESERSKDNQREVTMTEEGQQRSAVAAEEGWQVRRVDRKPGQPCRNDGYRGVSERCLNDGALLAEPNKDMQYEEIGTKEHDRIWKQKEGIDCQKEASEREKEKDNSGILGLTIRIHFTHRRDLVFKTDFKTVEQVGG